MHCATDVEDIQLFALMSHGLHLCKQDLFKGQATSSNLKAHQKMGEFGQKNYESLCWHWTKKKPILKIGQTLGMNFNAQIM